MKLLLALCAFAACRLAQLTKLNAMPLAAANAGS